MEKFDRKKKLKRKILRNREDEDEKKDDGKVDIEKLEKAFGRLFECPIDNAGDFETLTIKNNEQKAKEEAAVAAANGAGPGGAPAASPTGVWKKGISLKKFSIPGMNFKQVAKKFSSGYIADLLDALDVTLLALFKKDFESMYDAFANVTPNKDLFLESEEENAEHHKKFAEKLQNEKGIEDPTSAKSIDYNHFAAGVTEFKWGFEGVDLKANFTGNKALNLFTQFDQDTDGVLSLREFLLLAIVKWKDKNSGDCKHCFKKTKKYVDYLYDVVNCKNDESGISSYQLWRSLKEIPTNGVKILPT